VLVPPRGELIRLILHYKGVEFVDNKIPFEKWDDPRLAVQSTSSLGIRRPCFSAELRYCKISGQRVGLVTWADLALFEIIDLGLLYRNNSLLGFPLLEGYHYRVSSLPTLTGYLEKRNCKE
ncbi:hypothetical protein MXB_2480, partial [Myxobolus squamalis]